MNATTSIPIDAVVPNMSHPRQHVDEDSLEQLASGGDDRARDMSEEK